MDKVNGFSTGDQSRFFGSPPAFIRVSMTWGWALDLIAWVSGVLPTRGIPVRALGSGPGLHQSRDDFRMGTPFDCVVQRGLPAQPFRGTRVGFGAGFHQSGDDCRIGIMLCRQMQRSLAELSFGIRVAPRLIRMLRTLGLVLERAAISRGVKPCLPWARALGLAPASSRAVTTPGFSL